MDIAKLKNILKNFTVLYVEDEEELRESVLVYFQKLFKNVVSAKDGAEGLELYRKGDFDIIITDIHMPNLDGIEMSKKIKELNSKQEILIISAYSEIKYFIESIKIGVSGYIIKPVDFAQMNEELYKIADKLKKFKENELYHHHLEDLIDERTKEKGVLQTQIIENYQQTLLALVSMIEKRDTYTGGHSQRVAEYSVIIAKEMGCGDEECKKLYNAGILHDIGKMTTPDSVLLKPGRLNDIERKLIQEHVTSGYDVLKKILMYKKLAEIILYHHERYDGKGYPNGLKGDEIPFLSRIMIVADAFDAMTTNRIYKKKKSVEVAIKEIEELSGTQFHPEVAKIASKALKDVVIKHISSQLPKNELERERFSYFYKDQVVEAYNKNYLELVLSENYHSKKYKCLTVFFFHGLATYNEKHGWKKGDEILSKFVLYLKEKYQDTLIFRINGNDFILLSEKHIQIDDDFFKKIEFLKDSNININKKHVDFGKEKIYSLEVLQKSVCIN